MSNQMQPSSIAAAQGSVMSAAAALADTFQTPFDFWVYRSGEWELLPPLKPVGADRPRRESPVAETVERLAQLDASDFPPQLYPLDDGRTLLIIPIHHAGEPPAAATAAFETGEPELVEQLARLFLRDFKRNELVERLREENDAFAQQVTENLEELVFLRQMAERLEVVEVSKDVLQMAEAVLPLLAESIRAESIAIMGARESIGPSGERIVGVGAPLLWRGPQNVDRDVCRRLVDEYQRACLQGPVVKNFFQQAPGGPGFPGVREFILVPMIRNQRTWSWILALNRTSRRDAAPEDPETHLGDLEFGTGEATLLGAAAAMLVTHAGNIELFREKERLLTEVVSALVYAIEAKDKYTCGHSQRVALFGKRLAQHCGLDEDACERLYLTGLLHDVGKIGVSDAALKKPGPLTDEEFAEIKRHPDGAWAILHTLAPMKYVLPGVLFHHERFDGNGYPDGLKGKHIPLDGRILAVADSYDAMTSDRPYRTGMSTEKAASILREGADSQWDPDIVDAFLNILPEIVKMQQAFNHPTRPLRAKGAVDVEE